MKKKKQVPIEGVEGVKLIDLNKEGKFEKLLEEELSEPLNLIDENNISVVSKELLTKDENIDLKTDVSDDDISNISKLRFMQKTLKMDNINILLDSFLSLRVSRGRKGRQEFIQALNAQMNAQAPIDPIEKFKRALRGDGPR